MNDFQSVDYNCRYVFFWLMLATGAEKTTNIDYVIILEEIKNKKYLQQSLV